MLSLLRRLAQVDRGATSIEYTLIASLIAVAAIVGMRTAGTRINAVLSNVANSLG
jgi:pilus assembly protein Flp/PilA